MIQVEIQQQEFSVESEWSNAVERGSGKAGAMVAFTGIVREYSLTENVHSMLIEHYPGMTENSVYRIVERATERWELIDIVVIHRVGHLQCGEQIVLVLVTSTHRQEAFQACEFIMDLLKTEAVFWKKEFTSSGSRWVRSVKNDYARRKNWD